MGRIYASLVGKGLMNIVLYFILTLFEFVVTGVVLEFGNVSPYSIYLGPLLGGAELLHTCSD